MHLWKCTGRDAFLDARNPSSFHEVDLLILRENDCVIAVVFSQLAE